MTTLQNKLKQAHFGASVSNFIFLMLVIPFYWLEGNHIISHVLFYTGSIFVIGGYVYRKIKMSCVDETIYLNFWVKNFTMIFFIFLWMPFAIIAAFFSNDIIVYYQFFLILLAEIPLFCFIWWLFFDKKQHDAYARQNSVNINKNHIEQVQLTQFTACYSLGRWSFLRAPLNVLTGLGKLIVLLLMMLGGGAGIVISELLKATILEGKDIESAAVGFFIMGCFIVPFVTYCILPLFTSIRWWEALKAEIKAQYGSVEVSLNLINPNQDLMDKQEELEFMRREKKRIKEEKRKSRDQKIYDWLNK